MQQKSAASDDVVSQDRLEISENHRVSLAQQCEEEKRGRARLGTRMAALAEKVPLCILPPLACQHTLPWPVVLLKIVQEVMNICSPCQIAGRCSRIQPRLRCLRTTLADGFACACERLDDKSSQIEAFAFSRCLRISSRKENKS